MDYSHCGDAVITTNELKPKSRRITTTTVNIYSEET